MAGKPSAPINNIIRKVLHCYTFGVYGRHELTETYGHLEIYVKDHSCVARQ